MVKRQGNEVSCDGPWKGAGLIGEEVKPRRKFSEKKGTRYVRDGAVPGSID